MKFSRLLSEILHDPRFSMDRRIFDASYSLVMENLRSGIELEFEPKTLCHIVSVAETVVDGKTYYTLSHDKSAECTDCGEMAEALGQSDNDFINIVCIEGTMTRNGDDCTYGSRDHLAMMMQAADSPNCRGHILLINSGGGMVSTLDDYRDAINYCRDKGQEVVSVISELAASAACFTANMTSRIFAERDNALVGSLGMFAVFSTMADGTVIPQTNEVVHIRYAKQSVDKNYAMREAAEGNLQPIDDELEADLAEILDATKADRPSLEESQLTGKLYKVKDVMGSMVDEIGSIDDAASWLMADWNARNKQCDPEDTDPNEDDDPNEDKGNASSSPTPSPQAAHTQHCVGQSPTPTANQNSSIMFDNIASALGIESIEHSQDGVMLNTPLAESLDNLLGTHANVVAELTAQIEALKAQNAESADSVQALLTEKSNMQATLDALTSEKSALDSKVAELESEIQAALDKHNADLEQLNNLHAEAIEQMNSSIAEVNGQLATSRQQVADLTDEVARLNEAQGHHQSAGHQPVSNGQPASAPVVIKTTAEYDPSLSAKENAARRRKK